MYPEECAQSFVDGDWWVEADPKEVRRGQLLRAFVPHVSQIPMTLTVVDRAEARDHSRALHKLGPLRIQDRRQATPLPIAALPLSENEILTVYKAKVRPVVVVSVGGPEVPRHLRLGSVGWQSDPTFIVAPYYGVPANGTRAGWPSAFVERIRRCEYPQYMWDRVPIGSTSESILRLDHLQPIGRHYNSYEVHDRALSESALRILDQWLDWHRCGTLDSASALYDIRELLVSM